MGHHSTDRESNPIPQQQQSNQGPVNLQDKEGGNRMRDNSRVDQSEGAKGGGQPTSFQGKGAGFSRNSKHDMDGSS